MKKPTRKELQLSATTIRSLTRELAGVNGGLYKVSENSCAACTGYTKPLGGCP